MAWSRVNTSSFFQTSYTQVKEKRRVVECYEDELDTHFTWYLEFCKICVENGVDRKLRVRVKVPSLFQPNFRLEQPSRVVIGI